MSRWKKAAQWLQYSKEEALEQSTVWPVGLPPAIASFGADSDPLLGRVCERGQSYDGKQKRTAHHSCPLLTLDCQTPSLACATAASAGEERRKQGRGRRKERRRGRSAS